MEQPRRDHKFVQVLAAFSLAITSLLALVMLFRRSGGSRWLLVSGLAVLAIPVSSWIVKNACQARKAIQVGPCPGAGEPAAGGSRVVAASGPNSATSQGSSSVIHAPIHSSPPSKKSRFRAQWVHLHGFLWAFLPTGLLDCAELFSG